MITTSDGLQYKDALHVLLDKPIENARNREVRKLREEGRSEDFIRVWIEGWENAGPGPVSAKRRWWCALAWVRARSPSSASSAQA